MTDNKKEEKNGAQQSEKQKDSQPQEEGMKEQNQGEENNQQQEKEITKQKQEQEQKTEEQKQKNEKASPQTNESPPSSEDQPKSDKNTSKGSSGESGSDDSKSTGNGNNKRKWNKLKNKIKDQAQEKLDLAKQKAKKATQKLSAFIWIGVKKILKYTIIIVVGVGLFEYHTDRTFGNFWGEVFEYFGHSEQQNAVTASLNQISRPKAQPNTSGPTSQPVKRDSSTGGTSAPSPRRSTPHRRVAPKKKKNSSKLNCMKFQSITFKKQNGQKRTIRTTKHFFVILDKTSGPWKSRNYWTGKHIKIFFQNPKVYTKLKTSAFYIKVNKGGSSINTLIYYEKKKEKTILKRQEIPFVEPNDAPKAYISESPQQGCFTKK